MGGGALAHLPSLASLTPQQECSLVLKCSLVLRESDSREGWSPQEEVPHLVRVPARLLILVEQMLLSKLPGVAIQH